MTGRYQEDDSVSGVYTTDDTLVDASPANNDRFAEEVRAEQERIFADYQIELPTSSSSSGDDDAMSNLDSNLDTNSIFTDNDVLRAQLEAEERRIMADYIDYQADMSLEDRPPPSTSMRWQPLASSVATADEAADGSLPSGYRGFMRHFRTPFAPRPTARGASAATPEREDSISPKSTERTDSPGATQADSPELLGYMSPLGKSHDPPSIIILGRQENRRGPVKTCLLRMWRDGVGRAILLLGLIILMLIIAAVVILLVAPQVYGVQASSATSSDMGVTGKDNSDSGVLSPSQPPVADSGTFPVPSPEDEVVDVVPVSPTMMPTLSPTSARSEKPSLSSTEVPTPVPTLKPTPKPSFDALCTDSPPSVTFFVNVHVGAPQNCAWLATKPGHKKLLCQDRFDPHTLCPRVCGTCDKFDWTARPTPAPTVQGKPTPAPSKVPVAAPTSAPSTRFIRTGKPSAAVVAEATEMPTVVSETPEPTATSPFSDENLIELVVEAYAFGSTLSSLQEDGSPQQRALEWLKASDVKGLSDDEIAARFAMASFGYSANADGWLEPNSSVCNWEGADCDGMGRVSSISLRGRGMNGRIAPELGLLGDSLITLDLGDNSLRGGFPKDLTRLGRLQTLLLDSNKLDGALPAQIGSMTSLTSLELQYNDFTGDVPEEISQLVNLRVLKIWNNYLTGQIPYDVCRFSGLQELWIDCREVDCDCWTRCYAQCGGNTGVPCPTDVGNDDGDDDGGDDGAGDDGAGDDGAGDDGAGDDRGDDDGAGDDGAGDDRGDDDGAGDDGADDGAGDDGAGDDMADDDGN